MSARLASFTLAAFVALVARPVVAGALLPATGKTA